MKETKERVPVVDNGLFEIRVVEMENVTIAEINTVDIVAEKEVLKTIDNYQYQSGKNVEEILEEIRAKLQSGAIIKREMKNIDKDDINIFEKNNPQ